MVVKQSISISLDNTLWEMRLMCCNRGDFISHELHTHTDIHATKVHSTSSRNCLRRIKRKRQEQEYENERQHRDGEKGDWDETRAKDS